MSCSTCSHAPCVCSTEFTTLPSGDEHTLIGSLGCVVDSLRDIYTQLGARPYEVALVRTRWSGGQRGVGVEEVLSESLILPTPKVAALSGLGLDLQAVGLEEAGGLELSQIPPRFTEQELMGRESVDDPIPQDQQFYYEVRRRTPDGKTIRRRFVPNGVPNYNATAFQWTISLTKAYEDRLPNGLARG